LAILGWSSPRTHEFRLAPISDRGHKISADETVDDGQAIRCEQQHEERGE